MTDSMTIAAPILIPLIAAALCAVFWRSASIQRVISLASSVLLLAAAVWLLRTVTTQGIIASNMGGWQAPFGITMVADTFSAVMVVITAIMGMAVAIYSVAYPDTAAREAAGFHPLFQGMIFGVTGAFMTGDLFNLYVWFEVMLITSFGLLVLGGRRDAIDGGVKYVALNLVATTVFLIAIGLLYGVAGTLNMADLSGKLALVENQGLVTVIGLLFLLAFGMKGAVFPLFFWLPASYHTAPMPIAAIFAALLTKVGVYAIIRAFTLIFTEDVGFFSNAIALIAAATMITGVLGAAAHYDIRRILSFHIISQIGYMLMGLAIYTPLAVAGAILYIVHHIVVKANLFLIAGAIRQAGGSFQLKKLGGLYHTRPLLGVLFLIPALSLAGIPPFSGFWGKLLVIDASLQAEHYALAGVALCVGLLTLYSMIKIWLEAFWKPVPEEGSTYGGAVPVTLSRLRFAVMLTPIVGLAAMTMTIGIWTEPFVALAGDAAAQLLDPRAYIAAVMGAPR